MRDSHKRLVFDTRSLSLASCTRTSDSEETLSHKNEERQVTKQRQKSRFKDCMTKFYPENKNKKNAEILKLESTESSFINQSNNLSFDYDDQIANNEYVTDYKCISKRKYGGRALVIIFGIIILTSLLPKISFAKSAVNHGRDKSQSKCDHNHHHPKQLQHLLRHHNGHYTKEQPATWLENGIHGQQYYKRHKRHYASANSSVGQTISSAATESILNQSINTLTPSGNKTTQKASLNSRDSIRIAAFASKLEQWYTCNRLASNELLATLSATKTLPLEGSNTSLEVARCQAHFDGHLCWPATLPGQLIKLPCPRLNWLSNVEQVLVMQQREHTLQARVHEQQSVKSVINLIQLPITTTVRPTTREGEAVYSEENDNNSLFTTSLDVTNTRAFVDDESERPISQSVSVTGKIKGSTVARFARRRCIAGLSPPPPDSLPNQNEPYLMFKPSENTLKPANWQTEADYSECSISSSASEAFSQQHGREESQPQKLAGEFDPTDKWVRLSEQQDRALFSSLVEELERIEGAIDPYSDPDLLEQWTLCIGNIMRYQHQRFSAAATGNTSGLWCPIIFDGWRCWPSTKAGDTAYVSCPSNQPGFSAERKAHKICTLNGTWYRHPMTNRYWSNYTTCVDTVDLAFRRKILNLYIFGNLISLVALSASLIIFISFKNLYCTRVTIHKNLFLSFITNNLMWIIWYTYVVNDANLLQSNPIECQFWHILLHYFLISNYFWMFCEGLYLHTLLVVAFVSEDKILKWFYLLGWITPVPITVAYAYNRSYDEYYTNFCWMEESPYNLILMGPIVISLLLNLVFLINIVRVLVTKLRANNSPDTHQTRKAVRATLILIPLLGLHYILTPFRPEAKSEWEGIYEIFAAVCTSFQGLCVALLFCFCNGEVITVIKKKLKDTFNLNNHHSGNGDLNNHHRRNTSLKLNNSNNNIKNINFLTNNHHINSAATNNDSQTLRSVISSSSNGDIIVREQQLQLIQQQPILTTANSTTKTNNKTLSSLINQRSDRTNSNISNSSSLLTTITASPIQVAQTISSQAINDTNYGQTKTLVCDKEGDQPLLATGNGKVLEYDLKNGSITPRKLEFGKNCPLNRKNSLSGPCLDKAETVHLLQGENNHGVLTTTTSFSVLT